MQRVELALQLEPAIKEQAKEQQKRKPESVLQNSAEQKPIDTRKEVANAAGVSHDTVSKVKKIKEEGSPELQQEVRDNKKSINAAHKDVTGIPMLCMNSDNPFDAPPLKPR